MSFDKVLKTDEEIQAAIDDLPYSTRSNVRTTLDILWTNLGGAKLAGTPWQAPLWAFREQVRIALGFYELSSVLSDLNEIRPIFSHISKEDRNLVAYTPSAEAGKADKQIRTSLGRLLTKEFPLFAEDHIRKLVEKHNAEVNFEILWAEGEEIAKLYDEFGSVGACMSGKSWQKHKPAEAYDAPNIKLAYCKDSEGQITGRTLVFTPSEDDKRYIRLYGNPALRHALAREGFKVGNWVGAKFKALELSPKSGSDIKTFRIPYLDADGTVAGEGSFVAHIDGEIVSVSTSYCSKLREAFGSSASQRAGAEAYVNLLPLSSENFYATCPITSVRYNKLDTATEDVYLNGEFVTVPAASLEESDEFVSTYIRVTGERVGRYMVKKTDTIEVDGTFYYNNSETLDHHGIHKLDEEWYPNLENQWTRRSIKTYSERVAKTSDVVRVVKDDKIVFFHKSEVTRKFRKLASSTVLLHPDEPAIRTMGTGALVHPKVNSILKVLGTDRWDFSRGKEKAHFFGTTYIVPSEPALLANWAQEEVSGDIEEACLALSQIKRLVVYFNGRRVYVSERSSIEEYLKVLDTYKHSYGFTSTEKRVVSALVRQCEIKLEEMQAVEYPNRLTDEASLPEPVIEVVRQVAELV